MKPLVSPLLIRAMTSFIAMVEISAGLPRLADFRFRHAGAAERRIGVERVGGDAVAHASLIVVEEIGRHDLEIILRRVRERASAIAVAHRPDAGNVGAQLVVHLDIAARVGARCPPCRGRGRRCSAAGRSRPADEFRRSARSLPLDSTFTAIEFPCFSTPTTLLSTRTSMPSSLRKPATACETSSSSREIRRGPSFDHGHLASEAAIDLSKLKADVAAAQDHQMRGEEIDVHHRAVGEVGNLVEAGYRRNRGPRAYIDENLIGRELGTVHCHFLFRDKAAMAFVDRASL